MRISTGKVVALRSHIFKLKQTEDIHSAGFRFGNVYAAYSEGNLVAVKRAVPYGNGMRGFRNEAYKLADDFIPFYVKQINHQWGAATIVNMDELRTIFHRWMLEELSEEMDRLIGY